MSVPPNLGDFLRVVAASGSAFLLPPSQLAPILRVADQLPPLRIAGFERSLGRERATVDFAAHLQYTDPGFTTLTGQARSGRLAAHGWHGLSRLLDQLTREKSGLGDSINHVWLEFDTSAGSAQPAIFLGPAPDADIVALVDEAARATSACPPSAEVMAHLVRLDDLPGRIFTIGLFLGRPDAALRVCLNHTGIGGMGEVLEALGGSKEWLIPPVGSNTVTRQAITAHLAFDLTADGVRAPIGIEITPQLSMADGARASWRPMLDALCADGLCSAEERDDLLAFCGVTGAGDAPELWPAHLSGFDALSSGPSPVFHRGIHHIKLTLGAPTLTAKVYFGFIQGWRYPEPSDQAGP